MSRAKSRGLPDLSNLAVEGVEIAVRVRPSARENALAQEGDVIRISVTAPPADGAANEAVRKLLARAMRVAPSRLELRRGHSARDKLFRYGAG
ncbi:MAG TPA: DUF167 domain-containing protein [Paracoccaceae bacterium]|nr:DUF167 domain-containing protein [Paracoccaceae bacterium]